jgi:hypothetical protein
MMRRIAAGLQPDIGKPNDREDHGHQVPTTLVSPRHL